MVRLDARTRRVGGLTLVEGRLRNDEDRPVRATVETPCSPVYPPQSGDRPVQGWRPSEGRTRLLLAADQRVGVGFATPVAPEEPALRLVATERDPATDGGIVATPEGVADALGDPLPPAVVEGHGASGSGPAASNLAERDTRGDRPSGVTRAEVRRLRRTAESVAARAATVERRFGGGR
ncbi:hypothetical protein BRD13_05520 [Halobacteriales archaeon SW_5_70_135]|nr:MAG: hypothetical protein BRD13_05520 [Halobacteriales archaeon SW_5_70_135]